MVPAVVLRQHRARLARLGRKGALAKLASNGRETGNSHGETAGLGAAHRPLIMPDAGRWITADDDSVISVLTLSAANVLKFETNSYSGESLPEACSPGGSGRRGAGCSTRASIRLD